MSTSAMNRIDELQADRALWGLNRESEIELERALRDAGLEPDPSWEHSAAVTTLALQTDIPSPPSPGLIEALRASAPVWMKSIGTARRRVNIVNPLLAAAVLTMVVLLWRDREADIAPAFELRQALLEARGVATWSWKQGPAQGDVVWDGSSQRGYMRFRNLPVNDPSQSQYQLWIFDAKRDPAHPVDGGVFDTPRNQAEVIIPIDPKILVHDAQSFVVTVESPGGVVVSDRKQIVALAKHQ